MSDNIIVRHAETSDVETVVRFNHALFQEDAGERDPYMNLDWSLEHGQEYFTSLFVNERTFCLIAEDKGKPVGYLIGYTQKASTLRPIRVAELESMFVMPDYRSRGVGSQLVRQFQAWCKEQSADRISVTAYAANERAIRFYQRHGFGPKNLTLETAVQ